MGKIGEKHRDSGAPRASTGTATRQSPPTSILPRTRSSPGEDPWLSRAREAAGDAHLLRSAEIPEPRRVGEEVEAERTIYKNSDEVQSKPEQVRPNIVDGMLRKRFFAQTVLLDQEWIHERQDRGEGRREQDAEVLTSHATPAAAHTNGNLTVFRQVLLKLRRGLMGDEDWVDLEVELIAKIEDGAASRSRSSWAREHLPGMTAAAEGMDRATADYAGCSRPS